MPPAQPLFLTSKSGLSLRLRGGPAWPELSHVAAGAGSGWRQRLCSTQQGPFIYRVLPQYKYLSVINNYDQVSWVTAHSE